MGRFARVVLPGVPLHVTHRGNRQGNVFFDDWDRQAYLERFIADSDRFGLALWAFCLMGNHVHWLVVPRDDQSLARTIQNAHRAHAVRINLRHDWVGHLWANRYFSTVLDERHLWSAVRYVECNPVRAGIVPRAEDYRWSSARAHSGWQAEWRLAGDRPFPGPIPDWAGWLAERSDAAAETLLRKNSRTGRPTGSRQFIGKLECELNRSLAKRGQVTLR
ncbi:MAG: transposase [Acidobacteriota bacterium]